jgi:hypothetical protein
MDWSSPRSRSHVLLRIVAAVTLFLQYRRHRFFDEPLAFATAYPPFAPRLIYMLKRADIRLRYAVEGQPTRLVGLTHPPHFPLILLPVYALRP